jgi:hypothetical protein
LLHSNDSSHIADITGTFLQNSQVLLLIHRAYNPDLAQYSFREVLLEKSKLFQHAYKESNQIDWDEQDFAN